MGMGLGMGIVVEEASGAPQSAVDEAAILYASGQAETAERTLKSILDANDRRAWLMLFDLYRIQSREKEFEQQALDYALRFETSPPLWQLVGEGEVASTASNASVSLELPGLLNQDASLKLANGLAECDVQAVIRIDFSRIEMVDEAGATECTRVLEKARKAKRTLQVVGVDRLTALLQDLNRATHSRPAHWLLLMELYQVLGNQDEFENCAVDYAVRFEVSPPSWVAVQAAEVVQLAPTPASQEPADNALQLSGEITPANDAAIQQLASYAASHSEVLVDLAQVTRVDYASVSQFISVLMQCLGSGKTVVLRGHNALIHELFRVMGIDQLAQLIPHHPV